MPANAQTKATLTKGATAKRSKANGKAALKTAVIYLRVSTKEQATKGGVQDGYSLPAQRQACYRKADELGAQVVEEFKDAGESARTANRPDLKRMLAYIAAERPDYVIVHKVDRLARNRADDVAISLAIEQAGGQLVSVSEGIDDTPSGMMLHGIMSTIAEFYSRNLATETKKGTLQKVEQGGTPFRAPLGYLNVITRVNEREVRTIGLDPERAPLVKWLFEQYATGEWSYKRLAKAVTARGLTTRPTPEHPARPIDFKTVAWILKNTYYIGQVTYGGLTYDGSHEPLVSKALFQRVQDQIAAHQHAKEHPSKHRHYLAGSLRCARCGHALVYNVITGRGGSYDYFTCLGRLNKGQGVGADCDLPYLPVGKVERAVCDLWQSTRLPDATIDTLTDNLRACVARESQAISHDRRVVQRRMAGLETQRVKWAEEVTDGAVPRDVAAAKQTELSRQLTQLSGELDMLNRLTSEQEQAIEQGLDILRHMPDNYQVASSALRRAYNQACFDCIDIDDLEGQPTIAGSIYEPSVAVIRQVANVCQADAGNMLASSRTASRQANKNTANANRAAKSSAGREFDDGQSDICTNQITALLPPRNRDISTMKNQPKQRVLACQVSKMPRTVVCGAVSSAPVSDMDNVGWVTRLELATAWTTTRSSTN